MSYQKNYPNGWQSGEAGGTPITPAALDNIEKGIANALPKDGTDPMTADLPMGGHRVTGLGDPVADGDAVPRGYANGHFAPAVESAEYPGCFYRTVNGVVEWLNPPMIPGVEYRTTERWNEMVVYTKLVPLGPMPAAGTHGVYNVASYVQDIVHTHVTLVGPSHLTYDYIPELKYIYTASNGGNAYIYMEVNSDISGYQGFVTMKYTKYQA